MQANENTELDDARSLAVELQEQNRKLEVAITVLTDYIHTQPYQDGWLSPISRYEIKISGKFGYRELDALIKKLEIDRETFQNIEWMPELPKATS